MEKSALDDKLSWLSALRIEFVKDPEKYISDADNILCEVMNILDEAFKDGRIAISYCEEDSI